MLVVQNEALSRYITLHVNSDWKERDFVSMLRKYLDAQWQIVLALSGLRGFGKTTGILQAISDVEQSLYVCGERSSSGESEPEPIEPLLDLLSHTQKKYIFIDEFTWFRRSSVLDGYLSTLVRNGHRVVLTGTESFVLEILKYGELIHWMDILHCNLFSYLEYCRLQDQTPSEHVCRNYLLHGGLFCPTDVNHFQGLIHYVRDTIIDNLLFYMPDTLDEQKATAIVYEIFYQSVCPYPVYDLSSPTMHHDETITSRDFFFNFFGISTDIVWTRDEFLKVVSILKRVEIIVELENADREDAVKYRYYVVNPAISSQLFHVVYLNEPPRKYLGTVFEAVTVAWFHHHLRTGDRIYFLRSHHPSGKELEIDFIIADGEPAYCENVIYFEAKLRHTPRLDLSNSILSDKLQTYFPQADELGRYVIYTGKECAYYKADKMFLFAPLESDFLANYDYFENQVSSMLRQGKIYPKVPENPYYSKYLRGEYEGRSDFEIFLV